MTLIMSGAINHILICSFGTCCVFINNDGSGTITENCTYIQNPSYPSADTADTSITYTIGKCSNGGGS